MCFSHQSPSLTQCFVLYHGRLSREDTLGRPLVAACSLGGRRRSDVEWTLLSEDVCLPPSTHNPPVLGAGGASCPGLRFRRLLPVVKTSALRRASEALVVSVGFRQSLSETPAAAAASPPLGLSWTSLQRRRWRADRKPRGEEGTANNCCDFHLYCAASTASL